MIENRDGSEKRAFRVDLADNVATMLCTVEPGDSILVQGGAAAQRLEASEAILLGHKVALTEIPKGALVVDEARGRAW